MREIAADLRVDAHTVRRDLARFKAQAEQAVEKLLADLDPGGASMGHHRPMPHRNAAPEGAAVTRIPPWFATRVADIGAQVRVGELSITQGAQVLAGEIAADPDATLAVATAYAPKQLRPWTTPPDRGIQLYLFADLPGLGPVLEVAVSRFKRDR